MRTKIVNELAQAEHNGYFVVARRNGISVLGERSGHGQLAYGFGGKSESVFEALATLAAEGYLSYAITRNR